MKLKYPYGIKYSPEFGSIPTIKLLLQVASPQGQVPFIFLFDTGADVTSFPISAAKKLGIDLDQCSQDPMSGFEGTTILVYRSQVQINFNNKSFKIPCVFNPNEEVPMLLGRAGIVDKFNILLDGRSKQIIFEEI